MDSLDKAPLSVNTNQAFLKSVRQKKTFQLRPRNVKNSNNVRIF